ncbi:hypothetical protein [Aequorivita capsosiphonis]|uniref:hypothetical protein n=1 Tax=Aequorivita capsosiphonis TaxID=487317 RepID=UPI0004057903|nr:hypothetical protein [Aequorivita capsosiphonis]
MFSNFKIFSIALVISASAIAQESNKSENPIIETSQDSIKPGKDVGSIVIGPYFPVSFGDNFVNNGMDLKLGARISFKVNAYKGFYIGPYFSFFNGDVNNPELLGNYYSTTNTVVGAIAGYEKHLKNFDVSIGVGVGASRYNNHGFKDTATAVWLNPEVSYRLTTYLGVYFTPELRHDFMNIDTPSELKDTFNGVNYFNLSFGLRINLGTAYRNL